MVYHISCLAQRLIEPLTTKMARVNRTVSDCRGGDQ